MPSAQCRGAIATSLLSSISTVAFKLAIGVEIAELFAFLHQLRRSALLSTMLLLRTRACQNPEGRVRQPFAAPRAHHQLAPYKATIRPERDDPERIAERWRSFAETRLQPLESSASACRPHPDYRPRKNSCRRAPARVSAFVLLGPSCRCAHRQALN